MIFLWRTTLECGHIKLLGPYDGDEEYYRRYIGQIIVCEVCPRIATPHGPVSASRTIVDSQDVAAALYRAPFDEGLRARAETLAARGIEP